jgi:transcriptional regulator with XRE-family HTH domain
MLIASSVTTYHWGMLNERIKNLRLAKGLTLQQVGDAFGISAASVASWEKGKNQPDSRKLSKIAEVLGTSVGFLLNGTGASKFAHNEPIDSGVPYFEWPKLLIDPTLSFALSESEWVIPIHTKSSRSSFATRYPAGSELSWKQGPIPCGAIIFIDTAKELKTGSIALVSLGPNNLELARVELPAKPNGHYLQLITSGNSVISPQQAKVIGTVVEWQMSGVP